MNIKMELSKDRKDFIRYFFNALYDYNYSLLKYTSPSIEEIPETSDIDLLITEKQSEAILKVIHEGPDVLRVDLHSKSFVTFVSIYFKDCGYLEIDLIHRFDRKGCIYLDAADVLDQAERNKEGIRVASDQHQFEYMMLFYLLNGEEVPFRYQNYFTVLPSDQRAKIFGYLLEKYHLHINTLDDLYDPHKRHRKKIFNKIKAYRENRGSKIIINKLRYWSDVLRDLKYNRGYAVSFSGVDGAGKSTVLENINDILKTKYRQRTVLLRHRPSLLPILSSFVLGKEKAQERAKNNLPRKGKNRSSLSSLFRFSYYYIDYIIGQWYVYFKYILRGYTVLYDRYYFDFIADPKRSNIVLNKNLATNLYRFVYKPKVNIFLTAPAETILKRKNELNVEDIKSLTDEYKLLFGDFANRYEKQRYLSINNINLSDTLNTVIKECISVNSY